MRAARLLVLVLGSACDRAATTVDQQPAQVVFAEECASGYALTTGECVPVPMGTVTTPDESPDGGFATCTPACDGKTCGEDGCGGYCGVCEAHQQCLEDKCAYVPWCGDGSCDPAETCTACPGDCPCQAGEQCLGGACCAPATCGALEYHCGSWSDGCTGTLSCGTCSTVLPNTVCTELGQCQCLPECAGKSCGDDGCNGSCGGCPASHQCQGGQCVYQVSCGNGQCDMAAGEDCQTCPDCVCQAGGVCKVDGACCTPTTCPLLGKTCGSWEDGCGGALECGGCTDFPNAFCSGGSCKCTPDCAGKLCGADGCGGSCGSCKENYACTLAGKCEYQPWCGDGVCDLSLGEGCATCLLDCGCTSAEQCMGDGSCCAPTTCEALGVACGTWGNACGGQLACGVCDAFPNSACDAAGQCACAPACLGKTCGDDGCGGACGTCEAGELCGESFQCQPVGCFTDADCEVYDKVCDTLTKGCVPCLAPSDCGPGAWACADNQCQKKDACTSDVDCPGQVCLVPAGYCVDCLVHADCGPAALCAESLCIPAPPCLDAADCVGASKICHPELGRCVPCAETKDCAGGEICTPTTFACEPVVPCTVNAQCTASGLFCDTVQGFCVACLLDAECPEAYHCQTGQCELDVCGPGDWACAGPSALVKCSFNGSAWVDGGSCGPGQYCMDGDCRDQTCAPGEIACSQNAVVQCDDLGATWVTLTECGAKAICFEGDCKPSVCQPFELGCADDHAWVKCDILGIQWSTPVPCSEGFYCGADDQVAPKPCKPVVCDPGVLYCKSELEAAFCNDKGSGPETIVPCAPGTACATDTCDPIVCDPMTATCAGKIARLCNKFGTAWTDTPCLTTEYCLAGTCLPQVCTPNAQHCEGNQIITCDALGKSESGAECGATAICLDGACVPTACVPLERVCTQDQLSYTECNGLGTKVGAPVACPKATFCLGGVCQPQVCTPGTWYCTTSDTDQHFCNAIGSGDKVTYPCPDGSTCVGGTCAELVCEPATAFCQGQTVYQCDAIGTSSKAGATCPSGYVCEAGACELVVCTPNASYCDGDLATTCNASGTGAVTAVDCAAAGKLCDKGACMDPLCEAGTTFCSAGKVLQCNSKGTATLPGPTCSSTQNCVEDGQGNAYCKTKICTPGVISCQGPKAVECDPLGTEWELLQNCTELGQRCSAGFCIELPPCGSISLAGTNGYLEMDPYLVSTGVVNFTGEVWFKTTKGGTLWRDGKGTSDAATDHALSVSAAGVRFNTGYQTAASTCTAQVVPINLLDGKWHHVAVTLAGAGASIGTKQIFVDGTAYPSCQFTDKASGCHWMGCPGWDDQWMGTEYPSDGASYFAGQISAFRISEAILYTTDFVPLPYSQSAPTTKEDYAMNELQGTVAGSAVGGKVAYLKGGISWSTEDPSCTPGALCGDGIQAPWEPCDDDNNEAGDGCAVDCQLE